MITKITLNQIASYKKTSILETDKKVNLIYGLNGSGKSTLSNFLAKKEEQKYHKCNIEGLTDDHELHVYNQSFIYNNFFEPENLNGIFTLSKANRDAEIKINAATKYILEKSAQKEIKEKELEIAKKDFIGKQLLAKNKVWEIKTSYTGGDRVLEFCLEGLKSDGNKLLSYIESLDKPIAKPSITIEQIKEDVQSLTDENAKIHDMLPLINFMGYLIEDDKIFEKQIVGNKNSSVSSLIDTLGNSDWVKEGLKILEFDKQINDTCPFCQEKTISEQLLSSIKSYFDEAYENDIITLKNHLEKYIVVINSIPRKTDFVINPKLEFLRKDFEIHYAELSRNISENRKLIEEKLKSPSVIIKLKNSKSILDKLNNIIKDTNQLIEIYNNRINNLSAEINLIRNKFWELMRWDYDSIIEIFKSDKDKSEKEIAFILDHVVTLNNEIATQENIIIENQKLTINIDGAVSNINTCLLDLGINDFKIQKYSDILYQIVRNDENVKVFHTLSEGEKMIISFLYFIEQCRGKKNVAEVNKKRIVVIDDPISSLSHVYVFNVGRLIHNEFLRSEKYEQIFILTHSLYFFYELTDTSKERRNEKQKLFRLRKNSEGSEILEMKYEEIQNDYHSYWSIINDNHQQPALIANCMRNIIEYFYNFVEKKDLNNVFQKRELQENRFDAFNRFMNRESHSLGQNIFDYKEFNYQDFKDAFQLVFKETGYENHYNKMIRI